MTHGASSALIWLAFVAPPGIAAVWLAGRRTSPRDPSQSGTASCADVVKAFVVVSAVGHLAWEIAQLPLYTLWTKSSPGGMAFAVVHCTLGDVLITGAVLVAALVVVWGRHWPRLGYWRVAAAALVLGVAYTGFSEWHNVYVKGAWGYAPAMPTLTIAGVAIGLSPLLQWVCVPTIAFAAARP